MLQWKRNSLTRVNLTKISVRKMENEQCFLISLGRFVESTCQKCARETFPFINTIRSYKVKECLINDIISGLTVGVMQIPQGNITILTCPTEICQQTEEIREILIRLRCAIFAKNT